MTKKFKTNKKGKVEFTPDELGKLLDEVWRDGYNSNNNYYWHSPWNWNWYYTNPSYITTCSSNDNISWTSGTISSSDIATINLNTSSTKLDKDLDNITIKYGD